MSWFYRAYVRTVLENASVALVLVLAVSAVFIWRIPQFRLDASADSLLLEDDADLRYYQRVMRRYGSDEFLIIAWLPRGDLFSEENRNRLAELVAELEALEGVASVDSILDVPLFHSPDVPMLKLATGGYETLESDTVDLELARVELAESPMYRDMLINDRADTSAIRVSLVDDPDHTALNRRRQDLLARKYEGGLTSEQAAELEALQPRYQASAAEQSARWDQTVTEIRGVMARYSDSAELYLGGVPMISSDMVDYVRNDLVVFGVGVLVFLILTLAVIFRRLVQVIAPILVCILTGAVMIGFLGLLGWPVTVISSNFVSLLLIITMSFSIHLIVRYRELQKSRPETEHRDLVGQATRLVAVPCLYCALTTMVGFGSLIVSGIKPVKDFGLMMAIGIGCAYLLVFTALPAMLVSLPRPREPRDRTVRFSLTRLLAQATDRAGNTVLALGLLLLALGAVGIARLSVENRFIDYFREDTEIYQGMQLIDEELGGTTPIEIIIDGEGDGYWAKQVNRDKLRRIHEFLQSLPETGKVLSLDTTMRIAEGINDGQPINDFVFAMLRRALPSNIREQVLTPFVDDAFSQARVNVRVLETNPDLKRAVLVDKIEGFLTDEIGLARDDFRLTGIYILYNNLLQSLFDSQIKTLGMVFLATWLMFTVLFRSPYLALIALVPNAFPVLVVLGTLGWLRIPLDIMTVTIAAITIGIAVDHTIHYIHRFKREFRALGDYRETTYRCHASIGNAMYYTSITIIVGFSILSLSNFIPTIYFGIFTGLAMVVALLSAMTLLPKLLMVLRPLGPEGSMSEASSTKA